MKDEIMRAICFWSKKLNESKQLNESVISMKSDLKAALSKFARITAMSEIGDALVFDVIFDYEKYEVRCTMHEETSNSHLPDEEDYEVLKIDVFRVEESDLGPYHNKKVKVNTIECNSEDNLENAFKLALDA